MARTSFVDVALRLRGARRFNAEVQAATAQLEKMGIRGAAAMGAFAQKSERFKSLGRSLTMGVTLPVVGASAAAIKLSMDYNATFGKIERLVGVSSKQLEAWKEDVLAISDETALPAEELGEALFFVTSAGQRGATAIDTLRASAQAGAAGLGETKTVADAVTSAMNAYGANVLSASQATDILIKAVSEGKMEPTDLAGNLGKVIPIAQAMGVSFDQATASMAVMTRAGASASQAATQVSGILLTFAKPTTQMVEALDAMGLSLGGVRKQLRNQGLVPTLTTLRDRAREAGIDISEVFGNRRALTGVLQLTKNVKTTEKVMAAVADSVGALDEAFGKLTEGQRFQLMKAIRRLTNELIRFGAVIGPVVVPEISRFLRIFGGILRAFSKLPGFVKTSAIAFIAFVAALGPLLWAVGALMRGVGTLMVLYVKLKPVVMALALRFAIFRTYLWSVYTLFMGGKFAAAIKGVTVALKGMALAALANPYVLLAVALILLVAALVVAYHRVEWFRKAVDKTVRFLRENWFVTILSMPLAVATAAMNLIRNWNKIKAGAKSAIDFVRTRFDGLVGFIKSLPGRIANAASGMFDGIKNAFRDAIDFIIQKWESLKNLGGGVFGAVTDIAGSVIPGAADGATITRPGTVMVGERGPELLSLPRGASVIPLSPALKAAGGAQRIEVPVYLNGRQIALAVAGEVSDARARS